jgi:hypothetical protein
MNGRMMSLACVGALLLAGCGKKHAETATNETASTEAATTNATEAPPAASPPASEAAPAAAAPFDKSKIPVSAVALGAFPYLSLPAGYTPSSEKTLDMARYPVWVGDHFEWVEGKVYDARISSAEGKDYSAYEMRRNIEALVEQAGGVKITDKAPSSEAMKQVDKDRVTFDDSINEIASDTIETFLIHQKDRDIWVQFVSTDSHGSWGIVEAKPFVPSAKLLPPTALNDAGGSPHS